LAEMVAMIRQAGTDDSKAVAKLDTNY